MKKFLSLLSLLSLMLTHTAQAQDNTIDETFKTYRFGLFVGPSLNSLRPASDVFNGYEIAKGKGNTGFTFGLMIDYNINERYAFESGITLDWRGGSMVSLKDTLTPIENGYAKEADVRYKQQYLTIPFGMKLKATEINKMKFFVKTGVDMALLLSNRGTADFIKADGTPLSNRGIVNLNQEDLGKAVPVNFGWYIGPSMEYKLNATNSAYVAILYRNGFTDVTAPQNNKSGFRFSDGNIRSNSIALRVGYYF